MAGDRLGDTAQEEPFDGAEAAGAQHDQPRLRFLGHPDDLRLRIAHGDVGLDGQSAWRQRRSRPVDDGSCLIEC